MADLLSLFPKMSNSPTSVLADDTDKKHMEGKVFDKVLINQGVGHFPLVNKKNNSEEDTMKSAALMSRCFEDVSSVSPVPSMPYFLPAHHKKAVVPGMPSTAFPDKITTWVKSEKILNKCTKKEKTTNVLDVEWTFYNRNTSNDMMLLQLACPRTANIPGFPSLLFIMEQYPNMVSLLWTCPNVSLVLGSPSRYPIIWSDKGWTTENMVLWVIHFRKSKDQSLLMSSMKENLETAKNMAALTPSCSAASKLPGFPCALKQTTPSMVSILACCPKGSNISGFPSVKDYNANPKIAEFWPSNNKISIIISQKKQSYLIVPLSPEVIDQLAIIGLPSCPRQTSISGFPCATWLMYATQITSGTQSACQLEPKASEIPCLHLSTNERQCLKEKQIYYHPEELSIALQDEESFKGMLAVLPYRPCKASVSGCLSAQKDPLNVYLSPSCPTVSIVPGMISGKISKAEIQWFVKKTQLGIKHAMRWLYQSIHSVPPQYKEIKDEVIKRDMLAMRPSCANDAELPGFPSAPELNKRILISMISTKAYCPRSTKILGIPSVDFVKGTVDSSDAWPFGEIISPLYKKILKDESNMGSALSFNVDHPHFHMADMATLSPCARESSVPGFPSTHSSIDSAQIVGNKQENSTLPGVTDVKIDFLNSSKLGCNFVLKKTRENVCISTCGTRQKGILETG